MDGKVTKRRLASCIVALIPATQMMLIGGGPSLALVLHRHGNYGLHMHAVSVEMSQRSMSTRYGHSSSGCSDNTQIENTTHSVLLASAFGFALSDDTRVHEKNQCVGDRATIATVTDHSTHALMRILSSCVESPLSELNPILHANHAMLI